MRFIKKWSYCCARGLSLVLNEDHQKKSVYYYGFQIVIGSLVKIVALVAISTAFRVLIPALILSASFALFRKFAGGYHMKTYGRCLLITIGLFVTAAIISGYTYKYWSLKSLIILVTLTFITGIHILIKYAPKDTPNRLITNAIEIRKFKTLSVIYLIVWLVLVLGMTKHDMSVYALPLCFSVILELLGITPRGYKLFEKIEHMLTAIEVLIKRYFINGRPKNKNINYLL